MVKKKVKAETPSKARYDEQRPVFSVQLRRELNGRLEEHLAATGCSRADFLETALTKAESVVEGGVRILASRKTDPSVEDRVRDLEDLVHQLFLLADNAHDWLPICPHCQEWEMTSAEGTETESPRPNPQIHTWCCPKCGYFMNTSGRIDPDSVVFTD